MEYIYMEIWVHTYIYSSDTQNWKNKTWSIIIAILKLPYTEWEMKQLNYIGFTDF
jgi:hypothetical protein